MHGMQSFELHRNCIDTQDHRQLLENPILGVPIGLNGFSIDG
jgi:hypothetical protein